MRRLLAILLTFGSLGVLYTGCDFAGGDDADQSITLTGRVVNFETGEAITEAFVRVSALNLSAYTDAEGLYRFETEIDSTMDLQVIVNKTGFNSNAVSVLAVPGNTVSAPLVQMSPIAAAEPESGPAANIILLGAPPENIGVKESGSPEVAQISFQVADSLGRPVTLDNAVNVHFRLGASPGGGEFIYPEVAGTNNNGKVTANLSSGTVAGVVQIVAEAQVNGQTIRSQPVAVTIHGGLPDADHFSIGPETFNFPGLNTYGLTDAISVIVGDKYANPVKPGTAVYFTTTGGVIEGSTTTDDQGRGSVDLISANPLPADGIVVVEATTADEVQGTILRRTGVVFSGTPVIGINPSVAALDQTYSLTVTDRNGNPLVEGSTISVRVEGTKVKAVGNTNVLLGETAFIGGLAYENVLRGPGITEFTFRAVQDVPPEDDGTTVPAVESITITLSSPNGNLEIVLTPGAAPAVRTDGASLQMLADGSARVKAAD